MKKDSFKCHAEVHIHTYTKKEYIIYLNVCTSVMRPFSATSLEENQPARPNSQSKKLNKIIIDF